MLAAGLNPVDYKNFYLPFVQFPCQTGLDGSGVIEETGEDVDQSKYQKGSLVVFHGSLFNKEGALARFTIQDSKYVCVVPLYLIKSKGLQTNELAEELASLPCAAMTAYQAVFIKMALSFEKNEMEVRNINSFVVTAAVGGVGSFCLQYLKIWKEKTGKEWVKIIAVCSKSNNEIAISLGATHCIDYKNEEIFSRIMEITENKGVDGWIDLVDKSSANLGLKSLRFGGNLVVVAENPDFLADLIFKKALSIHNVALGFVYAEEDEEKKLEIPRILLKVLDLYSKNMIKVEKQVLKMAEAKEALIKIKDRHTRGKLVISIQ